MASGGEQRTGTTWWTSPSPAHERGPGASGPPLAPAPQVRGKPPVRDGALRPPWWEGGICIQPLACLGPATLAGHIVTRSLTHTCTCRLCARGESRAANALRKTSCYVFLLVLVQRLSFCGPRTPRRYEVILIGSFLEGVSMVSRAFLPTSGAPWHVRHMVVWASRTQKGVSPTSPVPRPMMCSNAVKDSARHTGLPMHVG